MQASGGLILNQLNCTSVCNLTLVLEAQILAAKRVIKENYAEFVKVK